MADRRNGGTRNGNNNGVPVIFRPGQVNHRTSMTGFTYTPEFSVTEEKYRYVMKVMMPGVTKENANLFITEGVMTIEGATVGKYREKFSVWKYKREVTVPDDVDMDKIYASMEDGVLTVKAGKMSSKKVIKVR
ncbi:HSP20-like chaperone [Cladochytrium replicatum]|nr:HSP20-like chaperone [Cladochytrium replicatum]